jgi:uncharacterized damage-inducible protein DinB
MTSTHLIRRLWEHLVWADTAVLQAILTIDSPPPTALREYAHVLGAEEVWLSRLQSRAAALSVWPEMAAGELEPMARRITDGYAQLLDEVDDHALTRTVHYTNSAGLTFDNTMADILLHVAMHGQYHRGKVNLILRQAGLSPAPADFISYARGVPAASSR